MEQKQKKPTKVGNKMSPRINGTTHSPERQKHEDDNSRHYKDCYSHSSPWGRPSTTRQDQGRIYITSAVSRSTQPSIVALASTLKGVFGVWQMTSRYSDIKLSAA